MIALLSAMAAAAVQGNASAKAAFAENHGGGRYLCTLATRRRESAEVWIQFTRDGRGRISKGDAYLGLEVDSGGPLIVDEAKITGTTSVQQVRFRSGATELKVRVYHRRPMPTYLFLTVIRDDDKDSDVPREVASGFCHPVVPKAALMQVKSK